MQEWIERLEIEKEKLRRRNNICLEKEENASLEWDSSSVATDLTDSWQSFSENSTHFSRLQSIKQQLEKISKQHKENSIKLETAIKDSQKSEVSANESSDSESEILIGAGKILHLHHKILQSQR